MEAAGINEAKARVRRMVAEALVRMTPSRRHAASMALTRRLMQLPEVQQARTIMAFLSLPTEIDTWPFIQWAWRQGKRIAVPRIEPGPAGKASPIYERQMVAVLLPPADVEAAAKHPAVRRGPLGILDVPDSPIVPEREIDLVLAPCQAVDRSGNRLGKGGGFYDRFLAHKDLRAMVIAVGFSEQVLDEVPMTAADRPVSMIVTDGEVVTVGR